MISLQVSGKKIFAIKVKNSFILMYSSALSFGNNMTFRRDSEKSGLPMYQTIVSFVRQVSLGGKLRKYFEI